jgi:hypothetical protein
MMVAVLLAMMLSAGPASADAAPPFTITAADGRQIAGAALLAGDRKIVVMVSPAVAAAARLVDAIARWSDDDPRWRDRVVVVVHAAPAPAREWLMARWGDRDMPVWGANPDASAWGALGFQGAVGIGGVEHGAVDWKLDGVLDDPAVVELPIRAWLNIEAR